MEIPRIPDNELERLEELYSYGVLDTDAENDFDEIVQLASLICKTPISLISLVDENRQWFKARVGLNVKETSRDIAFCAHAINHNEITEVSDALKDKRFADNPLVLNNPDIRFYAGMPLITESGHAMGTLCVIDHKPRKLTEEQKESLRVLGHQSVKLLELRQLNNKLSLNEEQFRNAFQHSAIGMALVSIKGNLLKVNKQIVDTLGYTQEELLNMSLETITYPDDIGLDKRLIEEAVRGKRDKYFIEKRYINKTGNVIWALLNVSIVRNIFMKPIHFICQLENITPRKKTEQQLLKVNQELLAILNSTHVSIIGTDTKGVIKHFGKGSEQLLGYSANEVIDSAQVSMLHMDHEIKLRGLELSRKYNRSVEGFEVFTVMADEMKFESRQWTYVRKDGDKFQVQLVVTPILNQQQEITGYLGIAVDIEDKIANQNELKKANRKLKTFASQLSQQNTQLSNFAHIISHNLRSPVGNLTSLLNIYDSLEEEGEKEIVFEKFKTVISHLSGTLNELIETIKIRAEVNLDTEKIRFDAVWNKIKEMLSGQLIESKAEITTHFEALPSIEYNHLYMESIMLNLVSNAIKYRSKERSLKIEMETKREGMQHLFIIQDNGMGIDLGKYGAKVFGYRNTFHNHKESKGIGLFMIKTQIEALGGQIKIESEPGLGTRFIVIF